jgi:hypothetical protein
LYGPLRTAIEAAALLPLIHCMTSACNTGAVIQEAYGFQRSPKKYSLRNYETQRG